MYIFMVIHEWGDKELIEKVKTYLNLRLIKYILYKEMENDNLHYHIILEYDTVLRCKSMIQTIKRKPKQISIRECRDFNKSVNYISKEGNLLHNNLINNLENFIETVKKQLMTKYKSKNFQELLIDEYEIITISNFYDLRNHVAKYVLKMLRNNKKGLDKFILDRLTNGILNYYYKDEFEKYILQNF